MLRPAVGRGKWQIALQLPRFTGADKFAIGAYSPNPGTYLIDEIPVEGRLFPVFPRMANYDVDLFLGSSRRAEQVSGLGKLACFRLGYSHGVQLYEGEALEWGQTYILVRHRSKNLAPCPESVLSRKLDDNDGWAAVIIGLPVQPEQKVKVWAASALERTVNERSAIIGLLAPIAARITPSGAWQIANTHSNVVIGLRLSYAIGQAVTVAHTNSGGTLERHNVTLTNGVGALDIGKLPVGIHSLQVVEIPNSEIRIQVKAEFDFCPTSQIAFAFENDESCFIYNGWDNRNQKMFSEVVAGRFTLKEIRLPLRGKVSITDASTIAGTIEEFAFETSEERAQAAGAICAKLRAILSNRENARFAFDGHGFGTFCFPSGFRFIRRAAERARNNFANPRRQWVQLTCGLQTEVSPTFLPRSDKRIRYIAHINQLTR